MTAKANRAGAMKKWAGSKKSFKLKKPDKTRVISICNQKGGCGKTTTAINLSASLALLGQRVLVIDLDAQGNATSGLGINMDALDTGIYDYMLSPKKIPIEDVIVSTDYENLHVAPSTPFLSHFDIQVASEMGRENRLKKFISSLPKNFYDYIIIDTPPSLGLLLVNALNASSEVHIAMQAHPFALDGLKMLKQTIYSVQEELNPSLSITGIVVTMFDPRTRIGRDIVNYLNCKEELSSTVYKTLIKQNIKIAESNKKREPVYYYDRTCTGAEDYLSLAKEVGRKGISRELEV